MHVVHAHVDSTIMDYCMTLKLMTIPGNFVHTVVAIELEVYCVVLMIEVVFLAQQETKIL